MFQNNSINDSYMAQHIQIMHIDHRPTEYGCFYMCISFVFLELSISVSMPIASCGYMWVLVSVGRNVPSCAISYVLPWPAMNGIFVEIRR